MEQHNHVMPTMDGRCGTNQPRQRRNPEDAKHHR